MCGLSFASALVTKQVAATRHTNSVNTVVFDFMFSPMDFSSGHLCGEGLMDGFTRGILWPQRGKSKEQKAEGRRQKAEGRRQKAEGRRQKAEGRRQQVQSASLLMLQRILD